MIPKAERQTGIERNIRRVMGRVARVEQEAERWSWIRLGFFVGGIVGAVAAYFSLGAGAMWGVIGVTVVGFWVAVVIHQRLEQQIQRYRAWLDWQQQQIARMNLEWVALKPLDVNIIPTHPFAHDIDIVGDRSLLRLMDTAVTKEGQTRLTTWLTAPEPNLAETQQRQTIVKEIAPRHRLRMKLAVEANLHRGGRGWTSQQLIAALKPSAADSTMIAWAIGTGILAWVNLTLIILNVIGILPPYWYATLFIYGGILFAGQRVVGDMFSDALTLEAGLRPLSAIFALLERWSYRETPALGELAQPFRDPANRPSRAVARVIQVVNLTGLRANPVMWLVVNLALPYDFLVGLWFNHVRRGMTAALPQWMEQWFTLEALGALANLAYLNPHYVYPKMEEGNVEGVLKGQAVGHPLLPDAVKVRNDFALQSLGSVVIVTGSNMSGKSSFLKTLGVNIVLANAGGAVDATYLSLLPMRLFASMSVNDSVTDGISFFYAEVKRLKALLNALETPEGAPLFFMIDEIFRGTNNRERLIGARSYTRALVGKHGAGLISTHDLELTRLASESTAITNAHFRETVEDGRMQFDYQLRAGPCPTTNALTIMAIEGLPVDPPEAYATPPHVDMATG